MFGMFSGDKLSVVLLALICSMGESQFYFFLLPLQRTRMLPSGGSSDKVIFRHTMNATQSSCRHCNIGLFFRLFVVVVVVVVIIALIGVSPGAVGADEGVDSGVGGGVGVVIVVAVVAITPTTGSHCIRRVAL